MAVSNSIQTRTKNAVYKLRTTSKQREVIFRMYEYFKEHEVNANYGKLVALATGASIGTVYRSIAEGKAARENSKLATAQTEAKALCAGQSLKARQPGRIPNELLQHTTATTNERNQTFNVDTNFGVAGLRKIIYTFYTVLKVAPTLSELGAALKLNGIWDDSTESLRRLLLKIGYTFTKHRLIRPILVERSDMIEKRFDYLRIMHRCRTQKRNIFFVGEICFDPVEYADVCIGDQLNVIIAGSPNGLLEPYIYPSVPHENITTPKFLDWVDQKLKNQLPPNSVVVMGSENYHCTQISKTPTSESLKPEMQEWLRQHDVYFAADMSKVELFKMIKAIPKQNAYKVDEILKGHTVLHVPRFHPDLNPMTYVINEVKEDLYKEIVFTSDEKSEVLNKLFSQYPKEKLQEHDDQVYVNEKQYWSYDMRMDAKMDEVILSLRRKPSGDEWDDSESEAEDLETFDYNYCED